MEQATNPVFRPTHHCKIFCSPGNGAGWVSWAPRAANWAFLVWMLTYEPLIEGLEWKVGTDELEGRMAQFHVEAKAKYGIDRIITARVHDLFVEEVCFPFEIREMEGMERIFDVSRRKEIHFGPPVARPAVVPTGMVPDTTKSNAGTAPPQSTPQSASRMDSAIPSLSAKGSGSPITSSAGQDAPAVSPVPVAQVPPPTTASNAASGTSMADAAIPIPKNSANALKPSTSRDTLNVLTPPATPMPPATSAVNAVPTPLARSVGGTAPLKAIK